MVKKYKTFDMGCIVKWIVSNGYGVVGSRKDEMRIKTIIK